MRMTLFLVLVSLATACATDDRAIGESAVDVKVNPATDATEPAFVNGVQCKMVFPGGLTASTQVYAIWPIGTNGVVNRTYNLDGTPNIYAVFGTGGPASQTHHVDGYDQFDHYHVVDAPAGQEEIEVENRKWDLLTLWPGQNFNPATYQAARSVDELMAQSAAGILSPVLSLPEIGFPPLVMYSPVVCP